MASLWYETSPCSHAVVMSSRLPERLSAIENDDHRKAESCADLGDDWGLGSACDCP